MKILLEKKNIFDYTSILCVLIFFVFLGPNFLKFNLGLNLSLSRIGMLFLSLLFILRFINNPKKVFSQLNFDFKYKYIIIFFTIWILYSLFSVFWVIDYNAWFITNFFLLFGLLSSYELFISIKNKQQQKKVMYTINIALVINVIVGMMQFFLLEKSFSGFYGNVNDLATILLFGISILIFLYDENDKNRMIVLLNILLFLVSIYFTNSRAIILGILIGTPFLLKYFIKLIYKIKEYLLKRKVVLVIFIITIAGLCIFLMSSFLTPSNVPQSSNQTRINLIINGLLIFCKAPIFGIGAGNIPYYMQNFSMYSTQYGEWLILQIHNLWLEILISYGIVFFLAFLFMYLSLIYYFLKNIKNNIIKVRGYLFFLISFIIGSISSSCNLTKEWFVLIFFITLIEIKLNARLNKNENIDCRTNI